jgi:magnesium-transporting ATPase (P-type)
MALKIAKGIWFVSMIIFLIIFFYNYAGLNPSVTVLEGATPMVVSKEALFYTFIGIVATINFFIFLISRFFSSTDFKTWFYGLVVTFNAFLAIAINYIGLYNSLEKFNYERLGVIIYGSVLLMLLWLLSWPIYSLAKRITSKR